MFRFFLSVLAAFSAASAQASEWPKPLHLLVVLDADSTLPSSVAEKTESALRDFLDQSPSYLALSEEEARARLGSAPAELAAFCESDNRCWQGATTRAAVDLILHFDLGFSGSREVGWIRLYSLDGPLNSQALESRLPRGGGAPIDVLNALLHEPASMRVELESGSTHLQVNGRSKLLSPAPRIRLRQMPPGQHEVIVEGLGLPQRTEVVRLFPGQHRDLPLRNTRDSGLQKERTWWGAWAGGALLLGGGAALLATSGQKGSAWR